MKNAIMKAAHEMTRETLRKFPGTNYRATFAAALRLAWEDARADANFAAAAARLAVAVVMQAAADAVTRSNADVEAAAAECMDSMPVKLSDDMLAIDAFIIAHKNPAAAAELAARLHKAAAAAPYSMMKLSRFVEDENGKKMKQYYADARAFWMLPESVGGLALMPWADAVETVAGEAYIVINDKFINDAKWHEKTLKYAAYDAAMLAVARCEKGVRDRARRARKAEARADAAYMENPDGIPGYHAPAPEKLAITRATLAALAQDDDDKRIINALLAGKTQKETAAAIGKTQGFVSKRIARMAKAEARREAEAEAAAVAEWMNGGSLEKPAARRARAAAADDARREAEAAAVAAAANPAAARFARAEAAPEAPEAAARRRADAAALAAANAAALAETIRREAEAAPDAAARKEARAAAKAAADDARRAAKAARDARRAAK